MKEELLIGGRMKNEESTETKSLKFQGRPREKVEAKGLVGTHKEDLEEQFEGAKTPRYYN
jgi:hypothetical protein